MEHLEAGSAQLVPTQNGAKNHAVRAAALDIHLLPDFSPSVAAIQTTR
jgi:hypothetical protein